MFGTVFVLSTFHSICSQLWNVRQILLLWILNNITPKLIALIYVEVPVKGKWSTLPIQIHKEICWEKITSQKVTFRTIFNLALMLSNSTCSEPVMVAADFPSWQTNILWNEFLKKTISLWYFTSEFNYNRLSLVPHVLTVHQVINY